MVVYSSNVIAQAEKTRTPTWSHDTRWRGNSTTNQALHEEVYLPQQLNRQGIINPDVLHMVQAAVITYQATSHRNRMISCCGRLPLIDLQAVR